LIEVKTYRKENYCYQKPENYLNQIGIFKIAHEYSFK